MMRFNARDANGAIAVITAILVILLFAVGALAVDIGNALSRKRQVQTTADFAALAGAQELPSAANAKASAYAYLLNNATSGMDTASWTPAQFDDNNFANGEIDVVGTDRVQVTAPPSNVTFGLANAIGFSDTDVQAYAAAAIRSPGRILPFFLPVDCSLGTQVLKSGSQPPPEPTPDFIPASGNGNSVPDLDANSILEVPTDTSGTNASKPQILIYGDKFGSLAATNVYFTRGNVNIKVDLDTDTTQLTPTAVVLDPALDGQASVTQGTPDLITVTVPDAVDTVTGVWYVRVENSAGISKSQPLSKALQLKVSDNVDLDDDCGEKSTGDFGLLSSPRAEANGTAMQNQDALSLNIQAGIDHGVSIFGGSLPPKTQPDNCRTQGNQPIAGGQLDEFATREGANCMNINNGNKVDSTTDGLVSGGTTSFGPYQGRLVTGPTAPCARANYTLLGQSLNNDVLSCFLPGVPGQFKLNDLTSGNNLGALKLDPKIYESPRFFFVPVLNYEVNPPNGFYPIVDFRAVFITDENPNAANGSSTASATNGLAAGSTNLDSVTVYAFPYSALPSEASGNSGEIPYIGAGPKIVRLVE
jgi:Flp pilus assembly protein TadG